MADTKTYRHRVTGKTGSYGPTLAEVFSDVLEEVQPDAKPLAYVPIPDEAVAQVLAARQAPTKTADDESGPDQESDSQ